MLNDQTKLSLSCCWGSNGNENVFEGVVETKKYFVKSNLFRERISFAWEIR